LQRDWKFATDNVWSEKWQTANATEALKLLTSHPNANLEATMDQFDDLKLGPNGQRLINLLQEVPHFTPLMISIHCGWPESSAVLLDAGAEIRKETSCGFSALQLAKNLCDGYHPREAYQISKNYLRSNKMIMVPLHIDLYVFKLLQEALERKGETVDFDSIKEDNYNSAVNEYLEVQDDQAHSKPYIFFSKNLFCGIRRNWKNLYQETRPDRH
jgi:hypothetical protein